MYNKLLHTPEGFRDIYGTEFFKRQVVKNTLSDTIKKYNYMNIDLPSIEFFDIFSSNIGTIPSNELFKFFDKEGNTLCLRPDFTPSIARVAATYFADCEESLRLMYSGATFVNSSDLQGKLKESMEVGCELIGDGSVQGDFEIISIVLDCAKALKIDDFQISIGNVEFFKGLCEEFLFDEKTEMDLREMISNKNYFGAKGILDATDIGEEAKQSILGISELYGSYECLDKALEISGNGRSKCAIERLMELYDLLKESGNDKFISFDLGMLSKYNYYTGNVFRGYTYGSGDAIFKGGRYDKLLHEFGKDAPAVGFSANVDQLVSVINRNNKDFKFE
ncbi:MAG: ATP phosphoribosyltransferase regulatory subunit [Lachnospiraceae bacterium]|nr:ATP phosphoribosyltransferase regulatory subunit [Lachnospiraceae bacterium]